MTKRLALICVLVLLLAGPVTAGLPDGVTVKTDIAYGPDPAQRMDVYLPPAPQQAPILLMVHGGAWRFGDKTNKRVVDNKVAHWVTQGVIFVSVNYRMIPDAAPVVQAEDVALALARTQQLAASWGGDGDNVILMGHSAGAHLVALISAAPEIARAEGAKPWKGAILLDSGALDVPEIMQARHLPLYDKAFGDDPAEWEAASPYHRLSGPMPPILAVCRQRSADSCPSNRAFAQKAAKLGSRVEVLPMDMTHAEINKLLGLSDAYTQRVDSFLRGLGWQP